MQVVEDFDILSIKGIFLLCALLRVWREGITSFISFALMIVDLEVIIREFLGLADLSKVLTLCVHQLAEVFMVGTYKDFMLSAFKVVSLGLKSFNNS